MSRAQLVGLGVVGFYAVSAIGTVLFFAWDCWTVRRARRHHDAAAAQALARLERIYALPAVDPPRARGRSTP